ncbi:5'-nucleotidase C-terminal domain-containing protein [Actinomyces radicidentis]|uniref:5'-nucleotidase C-terminal domain-containing protein n=1 Tax=Actinomyces radicidentis TaxID=111015 RepID=UPI0026DF2DC9|nr:5'-nucleotidase C-terminal domain-containing protein [Actinomyces radicidentis]
MTPSRPGRTVAALAALALAAITPAIAAPAVAATGDTTTINLLGITDLHGHIDRVESNGKVSEPGAVTLACEVAVARNADASTLFVSNGDNVGGSAYTSSILDDEPTISILNAMGLDVTSTGNHEFDQGITDLAGRIIPELDAPVLSANVTGSSVLDSEGDGNGTWVKTVNGVKVGFVGVVTDELPSLVSKSALSGLTVSPSIATANARATELKESGKADVVVVLAHEDADIYGKELNGDVDAVFGGHTHVPYAQTITGDDGNEIAVVQADHYGLKLGEISLTLTENADGTKDVTARTAENKDLTTSDCTTDAYGVAALVSQADADAATEGSKTIATLATDFNRGTNTGSTDSSDAGSNRSTESTASNLIADSFQSWLAGDIKPTADHYVGLMNPGGVRADYAAGELTSGEAYQVQPFGNEMAYATYTGARLKTVLAEQWQPTTTRAALMLGVSGNVKVVVDQTAADELEGYFTQISSGAATAGSLADAIAAARAKVISSVTIDGATLADTDSVAIASNTFLLAGGDSFTALGDSSMTDTGQLDRDVTSAYLKAEQPLSASYAKRQTGLTSSTADGTTTVRLTGLSFTPTAEQTADGAARSVTATVPTTGGSTTTLATVDIDRTVTSGRPETGQASLSFAVPADAATHACPGSSSSSSNIEPCATVTLTVMSNPGEATGTYTVEVPAYDAATTDPTPAPTAEPSAEPTAEPTTEPSAEPTAQPTTTASASPSAAPTATPRHPSTGHHKAPHKGHGSTRPGHGHKTPRSHGPSSRRSPWFGPVWPGLGLGRH